MIVRGCAYWCHELEQRVYLIIVFVVTRKQIFAAPQVGWSLCVLVLVNSYAGR